MLTGMASSRIAIFFLLSAAAFSGPKPSYQYFRVGNSGNVNATTTGGTVLMGGSTDVDAAFQWMCSKSGNGDFLVIRATGTDAYNPYIRQLCPSGNSVATLIIPSIAAANDPFVLTTINNAEAIWIAGGDQANYINFWTGTPVQSALNSAINRNAPIGGTSAGLNVLTQFVYSALGSQGVTSSDALANPYSRYITLARDFVNIPNLQGILGDPHFAARDRMGRDLALMCRVYVNNWASTPKAISVDEETALLVEATGSASVAGNNKVYFLRAPGAPQVCASKVPLTYQNINVYRIAAGGTFNLLNWTGTGGASYSVSANAGVLSSTQQNTSIY